MKSAFAKQQDKLEAALAQLDSRPAVVCDLWRDIRGNHRLGVSVLFITLDWRMWNVCLCVQDFPVAHTAANIKVRKTSALFLRS